MSEPELLSLTAAIVSSHVSNNLVATGDLPTLIENVYAALTAAGAPNSAETASPVPAVSIKRSVTPDFIICLEDGKKLKLLKRHLRDAFGMTPDVYRAKWRLPADYPMVAPNYAAHRRSLALKIGLGRKPVIPPVAAPATLTRARASRKVAIST